jgi:hypothetical protein
LAARGEPSPGMRLIGSSVRKEPAMISQETSQNAAVSTHGESRDEIRTELCRILDMLGTARSDTSAIQARFEELWNRLGEDAQQTLH